MQLIVISQILLQIKITVSTNRGASNKRNNDDVDATESSSEESDSSSSSSNGSNSKSNLRPAQEKVKNYVIA